MVAPHVQALMDMGSDALPPYTRRRGAFFPNLHRPQPQPDRESASLPPLPSSSPVTGGDEDPQYQPTPEEAEHRFLSEYTHVRQIGNSSEGIIDLKHHTPSGELKVFKRSHSKWHMPPVNIDLTKEARKIRKLQDIAVHDNIVKADFGKTLLDGSQIVCLEYCAGGSLYLQMKRFTSMMVSPPRLFVLHVTIAMGEALAYIHECLTPTDRPGEYTSHDTVSDVLIHRDIKPDNVFLRLPLDRYGMPTPVLGDWGQSTTSAVSGGGTYGYQSPEQQNGQPVTSQSDIYSLGLMIYELCKVPTERFWPTGKDPEDLELPDAYKGLAVQEFLERCLDVAPKRRPAMTEGVGLHWITIFRNIREAFSKTEEINPAVWCNDDSVDLQAAGVWESCNDNEMEVE